MFYRIVVVISLALSILTAASAQKLCQGFGPQTPRDISKTEGSNQRIFTLAPAASQMNLCNIHTHTNAEHKGPGFSVFAGAGEHGGYQCNETASLTAAELKDPANGQGAFHGVKPGDTIEVHWVHTSCDITPRARDLRHAEVIAVQTPNYGLRLRFSLSSMIAMH